MEIVIFVIRSKLGRRKARVSVSKVRGGVRFSEHSEIRGGSGFVSSGRRFDTPALTTPVCYGHMAHVVPK